MLTVVTELNALLTSALLLSESQKTCSELNHILKFLTTLQINS